MYPSSITTEQAKELLDAQAHIWNHIFSFLNSMALKCALELGIPDAIQRHGKPITFTNLTNSLPIHPTKASSLGRLMRLLCHSNFFSHKMLANGEPIFDLTINSQLLLKDHPLTLAPFTLALLGPTMTDPARYLSCWFKNSEESPFHVANGKSFWEYCGQVEGFNECFNKAMASDSRLVACLLVANKGLFEGIKSLVDVGGGDGTLAKAIAKSHPELKCIVFDLPHVVEGHLQEIHEDNFVYVAGDMFEAIPPADTILLKWILHDWSDEHCIKILERCKEAIPSKDQGGKVIIIDVVLGNQIDRVNYTGAHILFDMEMMSLNNGGKERSEEEWKKLFISASFNDYKIFPVLGPRSIIEIYPL